MYKKVLVTVLSLYSITCFADTTADYYMRQGTKAYIAFECYFYANGNYKKEAGRLYKVGYKYALETATAYVKKKFKPSDAKVPIPVSDSLFHLSGLLISQPPNITPEFVVGEMFNDAGVLALRYGTSNLFDDSLTKTYSKLYESSNCSVIN